MSSIRKLLVAAASPGSLPTQGDLTVPEAPEITLEEDALDRHLRLERERDYQNSMRAQGGERPLTFAEVAARDDAHRSRQQEGGMPEDEECVFAEPDCGEVVMWDASGEPWCAKCRDRARAEAIAAGLNDPERPLQ